MTDRLIAVEGSDGAGKSTIITLLQTDLAALETGRGVVVVRTIEAEDAEFVESIIRRFNLDPLSPQYMNLYQILHGNKSDRAAEAIAAGKIVIADRWDLSFFTWHNNFGPLSKEEPSFRLTTAGMSFSCHPDIKVLLDVHPEVAFERRRQRALAGDEITDPDAEYAKYSLVRESYLRLAEHYDWSVIDAGRPIEAVYPEVWDTVLSQLPSG